MTLYPLARTLSSCYAFNLSRNRKSLIVITFYSILVIGFNFVVFPPLCENFRKLRSKQKWNTSARVEHNHRSGLTTQSALFDSRWGPSRPSESLHFHLSSGVQYYWEVTKNTVLLERLGFVKKKSVSIQTMLSIFSWSVSSDWLNCHWITERNNCKTEICWELYILGFFASI